MKIEIMDTEGHPRLTVHVDPQRPPTVVHAEDGRGPAITLNWDRTLDDQNALRHCAVCGCEALYVRRRVPSVIGFSVVCLGAVITLWILGSPLVWMALMAFGAVVLVDALIRVTAGRRLICYRCGAVYDQFPIRRHHRGWDAATAERYGTPRPRRLLARGKPGPG